MLIKLRHRISIYLEVWVCIRTSELTEYRDLGAEKKRRIYFCLADGAGVGIVLLVGLGAFLAGTMPVAIWCCL